MKKILFLSLLLNLVFLIGLLISIQKLGGISYIWFKMKNRGVTGVYEHRKSIFEALEKKENPIVFLGDSITEACEWSELLGNPRVQNRGIAGDMTDGVLRRLDVIVETQPSQVFLMIGVNDLIQHSVDHILTNYGKILSTIQQQSPSTKVYVQSVLPVNNELRQTQVSNEDILKINIGLQKLCQKYKLDYIDLHRLLQDSNGNLDANYTNDGIHLNGKAYLVWKVVVEEQLNPLL